MTIEKFSTDQSKPERLMTMNTTTRSGRFPDGKIKKEARFSKDFILLAGVTTLGDLLMAAVLLK